MRSDHMLRCPTCKARYKKGKTCYRCHTDLGPLLDVAHAAQTHLAAAYTAFVDEDYQNAWLHARRSYALKRNPLTLKLLACTALLTGQRCTATSLWSHLDHSGKYRFPDS